MVMGIPPEMAEGQGTIQIIGSSIVSNHLFRDSASGAMCINMVISSMSLVGMRLDPTADDCHVPTHLEVTDSD